MRRDVQEIFKMTPYDKQVMMFSATLRKDIRPVCKKFMQNVISALPLPYFRNQFVIVYKFLVMWVHFLVLFSNVCLVVVYYNGS